MGEAHAGKNTSLKVSGAAVSFGSAQTMQLISGTGGKTWQIQDVSKDIWDPRASFTIQVNGSTVSPSNYDIDYLFGVVQFDADQSGNTVEVTAGDYFPHYFIPMARTIEWGESQETHDVTTFFDTAETFILGRKQLEAVVEHLDNQYDPLDGSGGSEKTLQEIVDQGARLVLEFGPQGTDDATKSGARQGPVHRAFVRPSSKNSSGSTGSETTKEITFVLDRIEAAMSTQTSKSVDNFDYS